MSKSSLHLQIQAFGADDGFRWSLSTLFCNLSVQNSMGMASKAIVEHALIQLAALQRWSQAAFFKSSQNTFVSKNLQFYTSKLMQRRLSPPMTLSKNSNMMVGLQKCWFNIFLLEVFCRQHITNLFKNSYDFYVPQLLVNKLFYIDIKWRSEDSTMHKCSKESM